MKKIFLFFIFCFILMPIKTLATSSVDNYNIEAYVRDNGNVDVCEHLKQAGDFNGFNKDLLYSSNDLYDADNISNIKAYTYDFDANKTVKELELVSDANIGDNDKYVINKVNYGYNVKIYVPNNNNYKGIALCYTLENSVNVHSDVGEFYWTFIGKEFNSYVDKLRIKVYLPGVDKDLRVWAHGPVYGNVYSKTKKGVSYLDASINKLYVKNAIDIRMAFNKSWVLNSTKIKNGNLTSIISEEKKFSDKTNTEIKRAKLLVKKFKLVLILWTTLLVGMLIYFYFKYDKEKKADFNMHYYRDIPSDEPVHVVEYLMKKKVSPVSFSATMIELIRRKAILIDQDTKKNNFNLILNDKYSGDFSDCENSIIYLLFKVIGTDNMVTIKEINSFGREETNATAFMQCYNDWKRLALNEGKAKDYYYSFSCAKLIPIIFSFGGFGLAYFCYNSGMGYGYILLPLGLSILALLYLFNSSKKTSLGVNEYAKWLAFKRFLVDFGRFDDKELPEISLWEKYLVYAHVLGCASTLEKQMKVKIANMSDIDKNRYNFADWYILNNLGMYDFGNNISHCLDSAVHTSLSTVASSQASSAGGFGGGFSGGSGGFGGGGGGGGNF